MPDLPELSADKKNELAAMWDTWLYAIGLTEDKLASYDRELNEASVLAKTPATEAIAFATRGARTEIDPKLTQSVELAEDWFRCHIFEYWTRFRSSALGHETYVGWLDVLKQQASDKVESLWKGRSEATDKWFQNVCRPQVQKALTTIEGQAIKMSLDLKLERARLTATLNRRFEPTVEDIKAALEKRDRKGAVEIWQKIRRRHGSPSTKKALYEKAGQDKADYYRWERGELADGCQADLDIRSALLAA